MLQPTVSIIVLTYNSQKHLPALFASLAQQTYSPIELIVVDNASADGTIVWLQQQTTRPIDQLICNPTNDWFAKGNNKGIRVAHGDYVLFCNDDVTLEPTCVEQLVQTMQTKPHCGMVGPKILKLIDHAKTEQRFDSTGLVQRITGQVINRGENMVDQGQYNLEEQLFGITGAIMLVSKTMLETTKYQTEYIDEDFVAYKDDIDLSWRCHRAGFSVWYQPAAVAYHARSIQQTSLGQRAMKPALIRAYSYRNHWWTLVKNLSLRQLLLWGWVIAGYELVKLAYICLREPSTVTILPDTLRGVPLMWNKRRYHGTH